MQGISALKHLLTFGYGPSDVRLLCKPENLNHKLTSFCRVVFGGESAGGRWTLSILAHLHRHRHSEAAGECVINPYEPLKGVSMSQSSGLRICSQQQSTTGRRMATERAQWTFLRNFRAFL